MVLTKVDPERNMHRFYRAAIEPDLFGGVRLVREWGRIGSRGGQVRVRHFAERTEAEAALAKIERTKRRKGYG